MLIICLSGSLRKNSFNTALLEEARKLAPLDMELHIYDISRLPMINEDLEIGGFPESVRHLMEAVDNADGLLMASPEYNSSLSPVLKNAIDWLSRAEKNKILSEKPGAIMGASTGYFGTIKMQPDLRKVCSNLNMHIMNRPLFILPNAEEKFSESGELTDEGIKKKLLAFLEELKKWVERINGL